MRLCLVAIGSRGDVAPVVSVGVALASRGHEVRVVTLADYASLVPAPLIAVPVDTDTSVALWPDSPALRRAALAQPGIMYALMRARLRRAGPAIADALVRGGQDADLIVAGTATRAAVARLAQAQGRAFATLLLAPLLPSGRAASGVLVPAHAPTLIGGAVSQGMWALTAGLGAGPAAAMARHLGPDAAGAVGAVGAVGETILIAADPVVSPPDPLAAASGGQRRAAVVHTGWIPASVDDAPPAPSPASEGLADFLAERPGAVLMTFGSCPVVDPDADARLFRRAAGGRPVVLQTNALPAGRLDANAWNAPGLDHRWLVPQVAAVVHHGGAGTTMTTLASGRPAVVVPHLGDQGYYARRVAELGVGVHAGPRWRLTAAALARALDRALEPGRAARARELGRDVAERSGAGPTAVALEAVAI